MNTEDNLTPDTLSDAAHVEAADGGEAVDPAAFSLTELNTILGKDFKDKEAALKAVKDTFAFVGKRREDIEAEVRGALQPTEDKSSTPDTSHFAEKSAVQQLNERLFYAENPQYKGYENIIRKMGSDPAEVVASDEFQTIFEKVKTADEVGKQKSVVSSSPRLAQAKSVVDSAVELANTQATTDEVAAALARGILAENEG